MSSWRCFLSLHPSWRPQRGRKKCRKERKKKKDKDKKPALTTPSGSGGETHVERNSGPSLESEKVKDNKANVGEASSTVEGVDLRLCRLQFLRMAQRVMMSWGRGSGRQLIRRLCVVVGKLGEMGGA